MRPERLPADEVAQLSEKLAKALEGVALAFGKIADDNERLINFLEPGRCPT